MLSAVKSLMVIWYYVEDVFNYVVVLYKYKILCNVLNTHKKKCLKMFIFIDINKVKNNTNLTKVYHKRGGG